LDGKDKMTVFSTDDF